MVPLLQLNRSGCGRPEPRGQVRVVLTHYHCHGLGSIKRYRTPYHLLSTSYQTLWDFDGEFFISGSKEDMDSDDTFVVVRNSEIMCGLMEKGSNFFIFSMSFNYIDQFYVQFCWFCVPILSILCINFIGFMYRFYVSIL